MQAIDSELQSFLESSVIVLVGTCDAAGNPQTAFGWGPRVCDSGGIELFVNRPGSAQTLANLRDNGQIAVTFTAPLSHRSVQLKGRCVEVGDPGAADWDWVARHRAGLSQELLAFSYTPEFLRAIWSMQVVRLRCLMERAFDQTPGPEAGRNL